MDLNTTKKIFSSELQRELTDFEGRGSRTSRAYISSKSYLPKVLLTSNPLIERDLHRKLSHIKSNQHKRQKVWEWNQRHFLVGQIFDPDYNLRFTKESVKYSNNMMNDEKDKSETKGNKKSKDTTEEHGKNGSNKAMKQRERKNSNSGALGMGVFMPPLHPSQRLIEKAKIPNQTTAGGIGTNNNHQKQHRKSVPAEELITANRRKSVANLRNVISTPDLLIHTEEALLDPPNKDSHKNEHQKSIDEETANHGKVLNKNFRNLKRLQNKNSQDNVYDNPISNKTDNLRRQNTITEIHSPQHDNEPLLSSRTANNNELPSFPRSNERKVSKSVSLPDLPIYKSRPLDFNGIDPDHTGNGLDSLHFNKGDSSDEDSPFIHETSNQQEVLCNDEVLVGVTRSLPLSVMIRANQNINKEVQKRKNKMIEQCKRERDRDSFSDPRWLELNKVLVENSLKSSDIVYKADI